MLDLDGGIGWELLTSMVRYKARQRTSAKAALAHPYFKREGLLVLSVMQNLRLQFFRATLKDYSEPAKWVIKLMARSGTKTDGGFTEAQLQEMRVGYLAIIYQYFLSTFAFLSSYSKLEYRHGNPYDIRFLILQTKYQKVNNINFLEKILDNMYAW